MIIVNLKGGMGNQMFQYALGRALAIKNKNEFKMDLTYLKEGQPKSPDHTFRVYDLGIFNVKENFATKRDLEYFYSRSTAKQILNHLLPKYFPRNNIIYDKDSYVFNPEILEQKGNLYLDGYWQTDKYFESIGPLIRREFTFRKNFDAKNQQLASEISNNNSVCLNVRRADYVKIAHMTKHHGVLGTKYFSKAINILAKKIKDFTIYVFSDDLAWCKKNLKSSYPFRFVGHEYAGRKFQYYLHHMTLCKHFIIPNSTFGWWAAWLCDNPDKIVIAPKRWVMDKSINTIDLFPEGWMRI